MNEIGKRLCNGRGMQQEHYAAIQSNLHKAVEYVLKEIQENIETYGSCFGCGLVFDRKTLINNRCPKCLKKENYEWVKKTLTK